MPELQKGEAWIPTVSKLIKGEYNKLQAPTTIKEAVEKGHPLVMVEKIAGRESILLALEIELAKAASMLNIDARLNLQNHQVPMVASELYETFKTESLEDFMLCFQRGSNGLYDDKLLRLDGAIVTAWMRKYLEEKYAVVESKVIERKTEEKENKVDYAAYAKRIKEKQEKESVLKSEALEKERNKQLQDLNYVENRKGYQPPSEAEIIKRELHLQWIKENIDPVTRKPKDNFMEEKEWLKINGLGD